MFRPCRYWLLPLLLVWACKSDADPTQTKAVPSPQSTVLPYAEKSAEFCQSCHMAITQEWRSSIHANATFEKDPLFRLMLTKAKTVVGDKVEAGCRSCHNPKWQAGVEAQVASAEGITCVVCHQITDDHPGSSLPNKEIAKLDPTRAPDGEGQSLCLSCHAQRNTGKGIPICVTGSENSHAGGALCVNCHMESVDGPPSLTSKKSQHKGHTFPGGHVASWVAKAATLNMSFSPDHKEVMVTITPETLGHSLPTGNPMRHLIIDVVAVDGAGTEVWRNRPVGASLLENRDSIFMRVFSDANGNAPVPPFASVGEPDDNRLQSATPHTLRYALPKGAQELRATLSYHLAPSKVLKAAKAPASWSTPTVIAEAILQLP